MLNAVRNPEMGNEHQRLECPGYDARSLKTFAIGLPLVRAVAVIIALLHTTLI